MIAAQRRTLIAERIRTDGAASIAVLAETFGVSAVTIRRDLDLLDSQGLVERAHGGATVGGPDAETPYADKIERSAEEKGEIAQLASGLVHDGDVIAVGPGSTTEAFARELVGRQNLTVVTNSLLVAHVFVDCPGIQVILTGGELRGPIRAVVGDSAVRTYRGIHADFAVLSGNGLDAHFGLSTPSMIVAETDRTIAACARELVVLADHTKFGVRAAVQTVPVERISAVVTDWRTSGAELEAFAAAGVTLHVAPAP